MGYVMKTNVGIIIVSYNASTAVRATLASLRQAKNHTASEILLIDNASQDLEREKIRRAIDRHVAETGLPWRYVQQENNLGFSGGNNVGIRTFLEDNSISHICLLNSDVIVSDYWLDRLVEKHCSVVSAVTNKADSEQCVPVDYTVDLPDCLDPQKETLSPGVFDTINSFSESWHCAWRGNLVEADVTFFCVLLTRKIIQEVGLLDETFFPGGFEDNDYCTRIRAIGAKIYLARDVFMHHWGSASFGQLQRDYFTEHKLRNMHYVESKHNISLKRRSERRLVSYAQDVSFALHGGGSRPLQRAYNKLYVKTLSKLITHYETEFSSVRNLVLNCGCTIPECLEREMATMAAYGCVGEEWKAVLKVIEKGMDDVQSTPSLQQSIDERLSKLAIAVNAMESCYLNMLSFLNSLPVDELPWLGAQKRGLLEKAFWLIKKGIPFLWGLRGIVFFGGYPYPEREKDGYFQRIHAIDILFNDRWRIYVDHNLLPGRESWFDRPAPKTIVLRVTGSQKRQAFVRMLVVLSVLRCRTIYFHSVLRMQDSKFGKLLYVPWIKKVVDIHGVVSEEFRFHNDYYSACLYDEHERLAVRKGNWVIVVSQAMHHYLQQKYRKALRGQVITLPIFPGVTPNLSSRPYVNGKPVVVYAGGLHKWQQVPKMIDAIIRTEGSCMYRFYCPDPASVLKMLPAELCGSPPVIVDSKSHEELLRLYPECHYGFILREDIIVNRVACPTKLVEYVAMGIIPIVDCEDIGDFKSLGMQFVRLQDFMAGQLPDEEARSRMAEANFAVYERLRELRRIGSETLLAALSIRRSHIKEFAGRSKTYVKRYFLENSDRGRIARRLLQIARRNGTLPDILSNNKGSKAVAPTSYPVGQVISPALPKCDVLIQVDNFLAGGLENVVLDLSETLIQSGLQVVLLVQGEAGAAVERARRKGMAVHISRFAPDSYAELLSKASPRLICSHYSIKGAAICAKMNIPLVQVIHNSYMWFSDEEAADFAEAARYTTAFIAVSDFAKSYSVQRLGVPAEKCLVIPNGIDLEKFRKLDFAAARNSLRAKLGLVDDEFVFLSVGAVNHQKNHLGTIRAFCSVIPVCPKAKLVILGPIYEQQLFDDIQKYISKHKLGSQVIYAGASTNPQGYYAMADAFVSAAFFEGGQLSLLEAVAANLPVITTEIGFATHFKGRKGFAVIPPPLDVFSYCGRIWELQSSSEFELELAAKMEKTYRERVRPEFSEEMLDQFDKSKSYQLYLHLVRQIAEGSEVSMSRLMNSWPNSLAMAG